MKKNTYSDIEKDLKRLLPKERFVHTQAVADIAFCLALRFNFNPYIARLAGLLHDCAKYMSKEEFKKAFLKQKILLSDADLKAPQIWHAIYGVCIAKDKYEIDDEYILSSIRCHTTGKINMSILDKIIYISDYIEPNRDKAKNLDIIRELAFKDIDLALYTILRDTVEYLIEKNTYIHPDTLSALKWIGEEINDRK